MKYVKLFFNNHLRPTVYNPLLVDDFVLNLPDFSRGIPFDPVFYYSECADFQGKAKYGISNWKFPTALQAVKIQANWFDILTLAASYVPYYVRWDRSDNPIWIWTSVTEDGKVLRFDIHSGDMQRCEMNTLKAYPFLVGNLKKK